MSSDERDDETLREYLEGDSALSRLYRRDAREQPDARLDARIRARARDAVARNGPVAHSPFARHWMVPTSLAAVFVLSVSVVLMMPEPAVEPDGEIHGEIHREIDGAAKTAADAATMGDAPIGAADVEESLAPTSAPVPAPARATKRHEPGSDGDDSGRDSKSVLGARQRAQEAEEKPGEKRKTVATQARGVSAGGAPPATLESAGQAAPDPLPIPAGAIQDDPRAWMRFIEALLDNQNRDAAQSNLRAFRSRYPDFPLPATLMPLAASLDAQ